jgi:Fic family protein
LRDVAQYEFTEIYKVLIVLSFTPNQKIEQKLKHLHSMLVESYRDLEQASADEKAYLNKCALISNVGATTRIENAVLTDIEVEWVDTELSKDGKTTAFEEKKEFIVDKLSRERQRSIEEVAGSRDVLTTVYSQSKEFIPLRETDIRALHKTLLQYYDSADHYAGNYKTVINKVVAKDLQTGKERTVLDPTEPGLMTNIAMQDLIEWYNKSIQEVSWSILVAIEFVFRFLAIHPFQDGNGRIGRALFLLTLLQSGDKYLENVIRYVAIDRKIEQNKAKYYSVLHQTSGGKYQEDASQYQYDALVLYVLNVIEAALEDIKIYRLKFRNLKGLSQSAVVVLDCFKSSPEKQLKVADIETSIELPRRTIQFALKTLADQEFLQRLGKGAGSRYQLVF